MEQAVFDMVRQAADSQDYKLAEYARRIVDALSLTVNAPSNWRSIGARLEEMYRTSAWIYETMRLWEYEEG